MVGGADIVHAKHLVRSHLAKERELVDDMPLQGRRTSSGDEVRHETQATQIANGCLRRLGLLLATDDGDKRHVN